MSLRLDAGGIRRGVRLVGQAHASSEADLRPDGSGSDGHGGRACPCLHAVSAVSVLSSGIEISNSEIIDPTVAARFLRGWAIDSGARTYRVRGRARHRAPHPQELRLRLDRGVAGYPGSAADTTKHCTELNNSATALKITPPHSRPQTSSGPFSRATCLLRGYQQL